MPLETKTIDFDAELGRLESDAEEVIDILVDISENHPEYSRLDSRLSTLDTHRRGVEWARGEAADDDSVPYWDEDVDEITLRGLNGGEYAAIENDVAQLSETGKGTERLYFVAQGTEDAPYLDQFDDGGTLKERLAVVRQLPIAYLKWAESRINEFTMVGSGNENSYFHLLEEKRQEMLAES